MAWRNRRQPRLASVPPVATPLPRRGDGGDRRPDIAGGILLSGYGHPSIVGMKGYL